MNIDLNLIISILSNVCVAIFLLYIIIVLLSKEKKEGLDGALETLTLWLDYKRPFIWLKKYKPTLKHCAIAFFFAGVTTVTVGQLLEEMIPGLDTFTSDTATETSKLLFMCAMYFFFFGLLLIFYGVVFHFLPEDFTLNSSKVMTVFAISILLGGQLVRKLRVSAEYIMIYVFTGSMPLNYSVLDNVKVPSPYDFTLYGILISALSFLCVALVLFASFPAIFMIGLVLVSMFCFIAECVLRPFRFLMWKFAKSHLGPFIAIISFLLAILGLASQFLGILSSVVEDPEDSEIPAVVEGAPNLEENRAFPVNEAL